MHEVNMHSVNIQSGDLAWKSPKTAGEVAMMIRGVTLQEAVENGATETDPACRLMCTR